MYNIILPNQFYDGLVCCLRIFVDAVNIKTYNTGLVMCMRFQVFCGGEDADCSLLGYDAVLCMWLPLFWRNMLYHD
jgi:hypothetical protein